MKRFAVRILEGYRRGRDLTRIAKILAATLGPTAFVTTCLYGDPVARFLQDLINPQIGGGGGSNIIFFILPFVALAIGTLLPLLLAGRSFHHEARLAGLGLGFGGLLRDRSEGGWRPRAHVAER